MTTCSTTTKLQLSSQIPFSLTRAGSRRSLKALQTCLVHATVDEAGNLVAAGMVIGDAVHDMQAFHLKALSFFLGCLDMQAASLASSLSGSCT